MSVEALKQLRNETGISMIECKKALDEARGNIEKAKEILRKKGKDFAAKKTIRETKQGIIDVYLHSNNRVGVLLELLCESDFVAKCPDFKKVAHELCLQIAAMEPFFVSAEDIPEDFLAGEKRIYQEQFKDSGKPQKIIDGIVEGKLQKYKESIALLSQPWIKDESKTIKDLIDELISRVGENIVVKRFARYEI